MITNWTRKAARGWYLVRYHRASQLMRRVVSIARRRYEAKRGGGFYASGPVGKTRARACAGFERIARARKEEAGYRLRGIHGSEECRGGTREVFGDSFPPLTVRFLNVRHSLPDPIDWRLECWPEASQLWRFHLHYHEFLLDAAADGTEVALRGAWDVVEQWIENNRLSDPRVLFDAWHPYCISRRLPVWICLWTTSPPDEPLRKQVLDSLWMQARYLAGHLERDLGGNHLLENLRALILAGCFLDCPEAEGWRHLAGRFLRDELAEQILPHGEHFERSPMYHAAMLDAVLDIRDAAGELMLETAALAAESAEKMGGFLREVLHPDGGIPLLGDSCFGETPSPAGLLGRTGVGKGGPRSVRPTVAKRGGQCCGNYWIYRDEESVVLLDAGPVGPDHLPAHAHADLLTFEASFRGSRLFVDSGVGSYQDDDDRRYCRSTAAHNALEIDGTDQCDMWSKFRMGYRGWPSGLTVGETAGFFWAGATHNAYRRLGVPNVGRWFACRPGGPWICVDWAVGKGWHRYTNRLHLYPEVVAEQTGDSEVALKLEERTLKLRFFAPGEVAIEQGWYYPKMGYRQSAAVVCWRASTRRPVVCGWALTGNDAAGNADLDARDIRDLRIRWTDPDGATELRLPGAPCTLRF